MAQLKLLWPATPICFRPEVLAKSTPAEENVALVAAMQELSSALMEEVPPHVAHMWCEVRSAPGDAAKPFIYTITNFDRRSEGLHKPVARVDQAMSRLVQVMNPQPFRGFTIDMQRTPDGKWRNLIELAKTT